MLIAPTKISSRNASDVSYLPLEDVVIFSCKMCNRAWPTWAAQDETMCPPCRFDHQRSQNLLMRKLLKQCAEVLAPMPNWSKLAGMISSILE